MTATGQSPTRARGDGRSGTSQSPRLAFTSSPGPLLVFLLVTTVATPVLFLVGDRLLPRTPLAGNLFTATAITATALFAWVILRREGVSAAGVGLDRERIVPGVLPVVAIWVGVDVFGYVVLVLLGSDERAKHSAS